MSDLTDYTDFALPPLQFPYAGKRYTVPPASIETGRILAFVQAGDESVKDMTADELWKLVLGTAHGEMVADDVPLAFMQRAGAAALADFTGGRDLAVATWEHGPGPLAVEAATETVRRRSSPDGSKGSETSPATAAATTTPARARTSGTRTSPRKPAPKAS